MYQTEISYNNLTNYKIRDRAFYLNAIGGIHIKITKALLVLLGIVLLLLMPIFSLYNNQPAFALQGQLDLVSTSFNKEKIIPLDGTWEFYESQLYDQEHFERGISKKPKYIEVPGPWSTEDEKSGSGTYRLVIQNVPTDQVLGIKKQNIRSASKIFINGKLVSEELYRWKYSKINILPAR